MKCIRKPQSLLFALLGLFVWFLISWSGRQYGHNLNLTLLYFIPVALWAWNLGLVPSIAMAALCAASWRINDYLSGHSYVSTYLQVWNVSANFIMFQLVGVSTFLLKQYQQRNSVLDQRLNQTLDTLEKSVYEIHRLQGLPLALCPVTKRVKIGNDWLELDEWIQDRLNLPVTPSLSNHALLAMIERIQEHHEYRSIQSA